MGKQDHPFSTPSLYWSNIMRSSRSKLFLYILILCIMFVVVFLLRNLHSNMKDLENVSEKCQQQRDSLSAQLQVLYEHKSRLDKSLQQEKSDHKRTKEDNDRLHQELDVKSKQEKTNVQEFAKLEKQLSEIKVGYSHLEDDKKLGEARMKEQYQSLQGQKDKEIEKLQAQLNDLLAEKEKLEQTISDNEWKIKQYMDHLNLFQLRYKQMEAQLAEVNSHLQKVQNESITGLPLKKFDSPNNNESENILVNDIHDSGGLIKNERYKEGFSDEKKQNLSQGDHHRGPPPNLARPNLHLPSVNIGNNAINDSKSPPKNMEINQAVKDIGNQVPIANGVALSTKNHSNSPREAGYRLEDVNKLNDDSANARIKGAEDNNNNVPLAVALNDLNHVDKTHSKETYNLPQVQPPNNFDNAGEQGELFDMFHQHAANAHKQQVEKPDSRDLNKDHQISNSLKINKNVMPAPPIGNDAVLPQQQDLLDRPPAELDLGHQNHFRAQHDFVRRSNLNRFNGESHLNGRVDGHQNVDGKMQYVVDEDDDQDGENDEEQSMVGGHVRVKAYPDNDFDDQENPEINDNAVKDMEGVMVAPK